MRDLRDRRFVSILFQKSEADNEFVQQALTVVINIISLQYLQSIFYDIDNAEYCTNKPLSLYN